MIKKFTELTAPAGLKRDKGIPALGSALKGG